MPLPGAEQAVEKILTTVVDTAAPKIAEQAVETAVPHVVEQTIQHAAPAVVEHIVQAAVPESVEQIVIHATPQAVEQVVERAAPQALEQTVEHAAPQAVEQAVEHAAPQALEQAVEHAAPQAIEQTVSHAAPQAAERSAARMADQALRYTGNLTADFAAVAGRRAVDVAKYGVTNMPVVKTAVFAVAGYAAYRGISIVGMGADKVEAMFGPDNPNPPQPPEGSKTVELADGTTTIVRPERPEDKGRKDGIIDEESGKVMYPWNPEVDDFKTSELDSTIQWVSSWTKESPMLSKIALGALTFLGVTGIGGMVSPQNSGIISLVGIGLAIAAAYYGVDAINHRADAIAKHDNGLKTRFAEVASPIGADTTEIKPGVDPTKDKPPVPATATATPVPA